MENRVKILRKSLGFTQEKFVQEEGIPFEIDALQSCEQGRRELQIDCAIILSEKYGVSLDWLYCRSDDMLEKDTMAKVIYALRKIIFIEKDFQNGGNPVLAIDKRFSNFIDDFKDFEFYARNTDGVDLAMYNQGRKNLFDKHKDFFNDLLDDTTYVDGGFIGTYGIKVIEGFKEDVTIENYLIPSSPYKE